MEDIKEFETIKVSIEDIKLDNNNPNKMTKDQLEALKEGIKKFGFIVPIVTNKDLVVVDGEHRYRAAKDLGMTEVPIIKLNVSEVEGVMLRQIMNKLKGEHVLDKDISEFERIINLSGNFKEFSKLMAEKETYFQDVMALKTIENEKYLLIKDIDEGLKDKKLENIKTMKLDLTEQQFNKIKEKFGEGKVFEIKDYFLVIEWKY